MILVAKLAGGQRFKPNVVFKLGVVITTRRGFALLEQDAFKCSQTRGIQMLNDLNHGGRVVPRKALVTIDKGALDQLDARAALGGSVSRSQPVLSTFEASIGHIQADDFLECRSFKERFEQLPLPTPKIEQRVWRHYFSEPP